MIKIKRFICNYLQESSYVAWGKGGCVIVDPGFQDTGEFDGLYAFLGENGLSPDAILLTHGHFDHILGVKELIARFGIPVYLNPADAPVLAIASIYGFALHAPKTDASFSYLPARDGDILRFKGLEFKVIGTPGHTPGCVCYLDGSSGVMFTGDTLFAGSIGRTDLQYGDYDSEIRSIMEKLIFLPGETEIYPGHGPSSTIARERMENPFLEPFNEREELFSEDDSGKDLPQEPL